MQNDEVVPVALTEDERELLRDGLGQWGGPAKCTEELAIAMGFASYADLFVQGHRIDTALKNEEPLTRLDWTRTLAATEFVFASTIFGAGWDWVAVTGRSDEETIRLLRQVQGKLLRAHARLRAQDIGTRPSRRRR